MSDAPRYPDPNLDEDAGYDETGAERYTGSGPPKAPRWVKVIGIVGIVVALLIVILLLAGGPGRHGPARHIPVGDMPGGHAPPVQHGP